jgi:hypothetical protein
VDIPKVVLTEREAAKFLLVSQSVLKQRRMRNEPPDYFRIGRAVRYRMAVLEKFIQRSGIKERKKRA